MTEQTAVELRPLCRIEYELATPIAVSSGPAGARTIGEIVGARLEGERLRATLEGRAAADWAFVEPSGRVLVDARLTVRTDDDAIVYISYTGRMDAATGTVYSSMYFETGDERYAWITRVVGVAKGRYLGGTLEYEVLEVV